MKNAPKNKHITIGVTGSIAAYKAADLVSKLKQAGNEVNVVMTKCACELIGPATFQALSGNPVLIDMFPEDDPMPHIKLADRTDVLVICPATANIIGKIACGIADDLLSTLAMSVTAPIIIAPAMNEKMYLNKAVQDNINVLKKRGAFFVGPSEGYLACGYTGKGKLADISEIISEIGKRI